MKTLNHFPLPERSEIDERWIYYINSRPPEYIDFCHQRNTSPEAINVANQYFSIENIFQTSFEYVTPIKKNAGTISARFGTVIREACNLYEIQCKKVYTQLFKYEEGLGLNIYNYLTLEKFFECRNEELRSGIFYNYLENGNRINPFESMLSWDKTSKLKKENVPSWWNAYNKIKHDSDESMHHATFENALYSIAAVFMVLRKIYGDGLISGYLRKSSNEVNIIADVYPIRNSKIFIGEIHKQAEKK